MLASVYSYRVMVKSISSCCVRARQVLSNPVTFIQPLSTNPAHNLFIITNPLATNVRNHSWN